MASPAVHTTGINWESIGVIGGLIIGIMSAVGQWVRRTVKGSVQELGDLLNAKLETKESVAQLRTKVSLLEQKVYGDKST
jgi:hypothetical protein